MCSLRSCFTFRFFKSNQQQLLGLLDLRQDLGDVAYGKRLEAGNITHHVILGYRL